MKITACHAFTTVPVGYTILKIEGGWVVFTPDPEC
jgi:hypothetical protein